MCSTLLCINSVTQNACILLFLQWRIGSLSGNWCGTARQIVKVANKMVASEGSHLYRRSGGGAPSGVHGQSPLRRPEGREFSKICCQKYVFRRQKSCTVLYKAYREVIYSSRSFCRSSDLANFLSTASRSIRFTMIQKHFI